MTAKGKGNPGAVVEAVRSLFESWQMFFLIREMRTNATSNAIHAIQGHPTTTKPLWASRRLAESLWKTSKRRTLDFAIDVPEATRIELRDMMYMVLKIIHSVFSWIVNVLL